MADILRITILAGKTFRGVQHFQPMDYDASTELARYTVQNGDAVFTIPGASVPPPTKAQLLARVIQTQEQAERWIRDLIALGLDFHFEDSPETIINGPTGKYLFDAEELVLVRARVEELYGFEYEAGCPIGFMLDVIEGPEWRTR